MCAGDVRRIRYGLCVGPDAGTSRSQPYRLNGRAQATDAPEQRNTHVKLAGVEHQIVGNEGRPWRLDRKDRGPPRDRSSRCYLDRISYILLHSRQLSDTVLPLQRHWDRKLSCPLTRYARNHFELERAERGGDTRPIVLSDQALESDGARELREREPHATAAKSLTGAGLRGMSG